VGSSKMAAGIAYSLGSSRRCHKQDTTIATTAILDTAAVFSSLQTPWLAQVMCPGQLPLALDPCCCADNA
jgi:hypothetical protein